MMGLVPVTPEPTIESQRHTRLSDVMRRTGTAAILTSDPITITYATGAQNMTVFGMMGPSRFLLLFADGPTVLYEFNGCNHLATDLTTIDEIRSAPGITALAGHTYQQQINRFADEVASLCHTHLGDGERLAVHRVDFLFTDALRSRRVELSDAGPTLNEARRVKLDIEIATMREAARRVQAAADVMSQAIAPGRTENEIWADFHQPFMASGGQYIVTRLLQSGPRTFPYFQECSERAVQAGDLVALDVDTTGWSGYSVDFSRTWVCGQDRGTAQQRDLHARAHEQLTHNAALLGPGVSFEDIARGAWPVPNQYKPFGYYCVGHGLGMSGDYPNIALLDPTTTYPLHDSLEPNMVICIESYVGSMEAGEGVKLEDQYLITETGAERMTTLPFDPALSRGF
jgi:Xaa-Pro dipeptidase